MHSSELGTGSRNHTLATHIGDRKEISLSQFDRHQAQDRAIQKGNLDYISALESLGIVTGSELTVTLDGVEYSVTLGRFNKMEGVV